MATTLLTTPTQITLPTLTNSVWSTAISAGVPGGTTGVILAFLWTSGSAGAITVRMTGSTDTQTSVTSEGTSAQKYFHIGVNASGQFDLFVDAGSPNNLQCWLIGYYGSEAVFFTNAVSLAIPTASFSNYNMASSCPGATAVFLEYFAGYQVTARINGSTDSWVPSSSSQHVVCGVDGSQIFQAKRTNAPSAFYCHGYMTSGITWNTNGVNTGTLTANVFQNLPAESGATGYIYQTSNASAFTVCGTGCNTATFNPNRLNNGGGLAQAVAGGSQAQVKPASASMVLYELGYYTGAAGGGGPKPYGLLMGVGT
jgi:hypothetical protein